VLLVTLKAVGLLAFIAALARPQSVASEREYQSEGIDIVVALDISGSMQAMDFQPQNRLEVAKAEAKKFILGREHDRIGLVVFARQSYTQCPLTLDYEVLTQLLDEVQMGLIKDGTAVGLAIANAVNRLRDSTAKSKVIILITDGANNAGNIDPLTAAELAKSFGIRVYAIGVGREGMVPFPVDDPLFGRRYIQAKVEMDEPTMQKIASMTGALYFRAQDEAALTEIYRTIDKLEKTKVEVKEFHTYDELFPHFLLPGLAALVLGVILESTVFLKIP
jgi:Ca-activated chloride channel family protein